ncbi:deoxyribodipyrimidine photo-lyase [bacterium]|nr:deoxyribodipyrimidine photo-lyase [bacterium]
MTHHLVWLRNDLRTLDNPALYKACEQRPQNVTAVFFITPRQWQKHNWGSNKTYFVLRNLQSLQENLQKLNIPLLIITTPLFKNIPKLILELCFKHKITSVFWNHEYEINERERDKDVQELLHQNKIETRRFHDQTILPPTTIKTQKGDFYTVFTPFKNEWYKKLEGFRPMAEYPVPKKQNLNSIKPSSVPKTLDDFLINEDIQKLWPAGEKEAHKMLNNFCDKLITNYQNNRDFPANDGTSKISPFLAVGTISAKTCFITAEKRGTQHAGVKTWINELIWRDFYRHIVCGFPRVCQNKPFKLATQKIPWENNKAKFKAWCEGKTGFPIVDAAINQLLQTGWMHNRLRMIVSMFLVKDLHVDWHWGEKFFMEHLIDGDFASNNGGWQWAASTGTDAAPYFRIFNPNTQASRFDPQNSFINKYSPALSPSPIVDHAIAREKTIQLFKKYS